MTITCFEDLRIWQKAIQLDLEIFKLTSCNESLSKDYGLRNQMNRSVGSIADNIAEGFERDGNAEFAHFLTIAKASCGELRTQIHRSINRKHITQSQGQDFILKCTSLSASIASLATHVRKSQFKGQKFLQRNSEAK